MFRLARLLIRERTRRTLAQFGWAGCVTLAVMLALLGWAAGRGASRLLRDTPGFRFGAALDCAWLAWVAAGLLLGKDLTWHVRLDRVRRFPVPGFWRLYLLALSLSFVSFPLFVLLLAILAASPVSGLQLLSRGALGPAGFALFTASARTTISILRTTLLRWDGLSGPSRWFGASVSACACGAAVATAFDSGMARLRPGSLFGATLTGDAPLGGVLWLAGIVLVLSVPDFILLRHATCSGVDGPLSRGGHIGSSGSLLSAHAGWPAPLWRISVLGWLRNRNAMMLFAWGALYGFCYMYFSRPDETFSYTTFSWMVLVFHSYLRGNLLGVDHRAAWAYYMLPVPVREVVRAKNRTLSLLQGLMVAAVLLPATLHPVAGTSLADWARIAACAWSNIVLGEIVGVVVSLRWPEPIERSSHFSGGMAVGGMVIPVLQLAFLVVFMPSTVLALRVSAAAFWIVVMGIPAALEVVSWRLMPGWTQKVLVGSRAKILAKLAVFSS